MHRLEYHDVFKHKRGGNSRNDGCGKKRGNGHRLSKNGVTLARQRRKRQRQKEARFAKQ